ncbi:MAG: 30S ribosomal protein S11 [Verrucomicrobiota bacterium]
MAEDTEKEEVKEEATEEKPEASSPEAPAPAAAAAPDAEPSTKEAEAGEEAPKEKERPRTAEDIFLELEGAEGAEKPKVLKAKGSKNVSTGIVHVSATFNNTIVSVSDQSGNVIGWSSSGKMGFRGSRKSTAYASQLVSQDACRQAMSHGLKSAEVRVKGPGAGRESAVRAVSGLGIDVTHIRDVTPVPHNGCRPKKARRV